MTNAMSLIFFYFIWYIISFNSDAYKNTSSVVLYSAGGWMERRRRRQRNAVEQKGHYLSFSLSPSMEPATMKFRPYVRKPIPRERLFLTRFLYLVTLKTLSAQRGRREPPCYKPKFRTHCVKLQSCTPSINPPGYISYFCSYFSFFQFFSLSLSIHPRRPKGARSGMHYRPARAVSTPRIIPI